MKRTVPPFLSVIGSSIITWWDGWFSFAGVTALWLLAQLTIVFGPPATFGLFEVAHSAANGEMNGTRELISGAKRYFKPAWAWAGLNLFVIATLYANLLFYAQFNADWAFFVQVFFMLLGYIWLVTQFYAIPFLMEMAQKKILLAIRNGFMVGMAAPAFSLTLLLFALIVALFSFGLILPLAFGIPVIIPLLGSYGVISRLESYGLRERTKTPKEVEQEESAPSWAARLRPPAGPDEKR